jgi:hypothetical protein
MVIISAALPSMCNRTLPALMASPFLKDEVAVNSLRERKNMVSSSPAMTAEDLAIILAFRDVS